MASGPRIQVVYGYQLTGQLCLQTAGIGSMYRALSAYLDHYACDVERQCSESIDLTCVGISESSRYYIQRLLRFCTTTMMQHTGIHSSSAEAMAEKTNQDLDFPSVDFLDSPNTCQIRSMLCHAAQCIPDRHVLHYQLGAKTPTSISYHQLYQEAKVLSTKVSFISRFESKRTILLYLHDHFDAILWLWATVIADCIPVLCPPLSNDEPTRAKYLQGLAETLDAPLCIVRTDSLHVFQHDDARKFQLHTIEALLHPDWNLDGLHNPARQDHSQAQSVKVDDRNNSSLAILMMTSGSTGVPKAVRLTHSQILASVASKASIRALPKRGALLNWIGLDHVAGLVEGHMQALFLGVDQVHVHAADVVASPLLFLDLLDRHSVSKTFAPNFFLDKLVNEMRRNSIEAEEKPRWDLSNLRVLTSGGEVNHVDTCVHAAALLAAHGAPANIITPGFGMTETCAGAIHSLDGQASDVAAKRTNATLGRCMPGIEMRVIRSKTDTSVHEAETDQPGDLEVRGPVVFDGYHRNQSATAEALSGDGWFRTGDRAIIDADGQLHLVGRAKDVVNINGVKTPMCQIQAALEVSLKETCASRVIAFPSRPPGAPTEQIIVAYTVRQWPVPSEEMARVARQAVQACMMNIVGAAPKIFAIRPGSFHQVPETTLGKISPARMRTLFESGVFDADVEYHLGAVEHFKRQQAESDSDGDSATGPELLVRTHVAKIVGTSSRFIGLDTTIFELGLSSIDVIRLKHQLEIHTGHELPTSVLIRNPTIRTLAQRLEERHHHPRCKITADTDPSVATLRAASSGHITSAVNNADGEYDPVVVLRATGHKAPLWLVHPGVGEVLVFVGLAQHLASDDRPVYALRARGFDAGQSVFSTVSEVIDAYTSAIKRRQPSGPYAIAGYSYGSMLAFEVAKKIGPEQVRFLGSFNLPPHIKERMQRLSWNICLAHLSHFLGLISERQAGDFEIGLNRAWYRRTSQEEALGHILSISDSSRWLELGLSLNQLGRWTSVAHGLQKLAIDWDPSGKVQTIDVFHAEPLQALGVTRKAWVEDRLSQWADFCDTEPRYHAVDGHHYTMMDSEHVERFSETVRCALRQRGM